ncbi:MAG: hypothetical protein LQ337_001361 [Flavoplaca oasis]|nr:MAG: hypothetical protein LQ337_001361 [Flavoplaca oasis]
MSRSHLVPSVCTGEDYIDHAIQPAFKNRSHGQFPAPQFGGNPFADNGWKFNPPATSKELPEGWSDPVQLFPSDAPKEVDAVYVLMEQAFTFTNAQGEPNPPGTSAEYQAFTCTHAPNLESSYPSTHMVRVTNQLSDALWESWIQVEKANPGHLRYYGIDIVWNEQATPLIEEIFQARRGSLIVPWSKRLNFDLRSDQGKALLASQSGRAVAWMMIHHAAELKTRAPRVTFWSSFGARMSMIWDLVPEVPDQLQYRPILPNGKRVHHATLDLKPITSDAAKMTHFLELLKYQD